MQNFMNMATSNLKHDGQYFGFTHADMVNMCTQLGLRQIPFDVNDDIAAGYKFESPMDKYDDGAWLIKWHAPHQAAPMESLSHHMWTAQIRITEARDGRHRFKYLWISQDTGEMKWVRNFKLKEAHIPIVNSDSDGGGGNSTHQQQEDRRKVINMDVNAIYDAATTYMEGEVSTKYFDSEKEFVVKKILAISSHRIISDDDLFELDILYTILCIYGDHGLISREGLDEKINNLFDEIEMEFGTEF